MTKESKDAAIPEAFREEARTLIHNVRGSVGIINSSLELIAMEEQSENAERMIAMIGRQVAKMLTELELFTERYAPRESAIGETTSFYGALTWASDALGYPVEISTELDKYQQLTVKVPEIVLRTIFTALLFKPSPLEAQYRLHLKRKGDELVCTFAWPSDYELSARFTWIMQILPRYGASFKVKEGHGRFALKIQ